MTTDERARAMAAATYNAAADRYDDPANSFWERFGRETVERLGLGPGARVLDVCCGSGASALAAAERVGSGGAVLGVDLADNLLALARAKARARGLRNIEFERGDLLDLRQAQSGFDSVVCVFGIFFVSDIERAVRELWRAVRPGGRLAITTWGPRFFEPASAAFWRSIRSARPDLYRAFHPWDRITEPAALRELMISAGATGAEVVAVNGSHAIATPEAWWSAVLGSGFRGTFDQLDQVAQASVRAANLDFIARTGLRSVEANVVYASATKPALG
jgi:ubiquinone/menaquinone biosynthesis C-methylase UbiE